VVGDEVTVQVLDVDLSRERISLSLKATQQDPWQKFAGSHEVGELVYGRVTKLVPFGSFVQSAKASRAGHISEMAAPRGGARAGRHPWRGAVGEDHRHRPRPPPDLPVDQAGRRGGVVSAEYQEHFGEHAYDEAGNYIGPAYEEAPRVRRAPRARPTAV
jgi:small subunit ribosomal protein S1